ncbi:MAG: hypothetical protein AAB454_01450 [Patescibacteria group bacterium]
MNNKQGKPNLGEPTEDAVEEATKELIKEDLHFVGYQRANKNDALDANGIDIFIFLQGGLVLPLQVKSSYSKLRKFQRNHPLIIFVLFVRNISLDKNSERYKRTIIYIKNKIKRFASRAQHNLGNLNP